MKMAEICVSTYGSNPINSPIYQAILNQITYLKRYLNILSENLSYVLPGYYELWQFVKT